MAKKEAEPEKREEPVEIRPEGSLGLLALGAVGIKAWREKRDQVRKKNNETKKDG